MDKIMADFGGILDFPSIGVYFRIVASYGTYKPSGT
jgi:hypothetical protein